MCDTMEGREKFTREIAGQDWQSVTAAVGLSAKVRALHKILNSAMNKSFEIITKSKKTSEPSWMLALIKKRRILFKRVGRSTA